MQFHTYFDNFSFISSVRCYFEGTETKRHSIIVLISKMMQ